jgi:hypothetical protein
MGDVDVSLLAERARAGSIEAFDVLVRRYEESILRYLVRSLGNREDAQDYKQQVFLKVWLNLASLQNVAFFQYLALLDCPQSGARLLASKKVVMPVLGRTGRRYYRIEYARARRARHGC